MAIDFKQEPDGIVRVTASTGYGENWTPAVVVVHRAITAKKELSKLGDPEGSYILIDPVPTRDGKYKVYVGESTGENGVFFRVGQHYDSPREEISDWRHALIICGKRDNRSDEEANLTVDEAKALEYVLWEKVKGSHGAEPIYGQKPTEPRVGVYKKVESYASVVADLMKLFGWDIEKQDKTALTHKAIHDTDDTKGQANFIQGQSENSRVISSKLSPAGRGSKDMKKLIMQGHLNIGTKLYLKNSQSRDHIAVSEIADREGNICVERYKSTDWEYTKKNDKLKLASIGFACDEIYRRLDREQSRSAWEYWYLKIENEYVSLVKFRKEKLEK